MEMLFPLAVVAIIYVFFNIERKQLFALYRDMKESKSPDLGKVGRVVGKFIHVFAMGFLLAGGVMSLLMAFFNTPLMR